MDTKKVIVSGVSWTMLSTIITTIVAILRLSILTRILDKADFGIVAILTFIVGLTQIFSDLGFSAAIMHKRDIDRESFSSLFWMQLCVFIIGYLVISLCSPLIAEFYNEPLLTKLLPLIMIDLIFVGIGRFYETILQKDFQFKIIALRNIVIALLSLIIAVWLAISGYGVYSLVYSTIFHTGALNLYNFYVGQKHIKIRLIFSLRKAIPLMKIGLYQTLTHFIDYFASKLDILLMGKFLGMENLGIYSLAKEILVKVYTMINGIANKVLLPLYSKMQEDTKYLSKTYLNSIRLLTFVTFPILVAIAVFSEQVVDILYGEAFSVAATLIPILALSYLGACISNPVGSLTVAKGRTDTSFYYTIIRLLLTIPVVYVASSISLKCLAYGQLILTIPLFFVIYHMMIKKYLQISLCEYISSFSKNLWVVMIFGIIYSVLLHFSPFDIQNSLLYLIVYGTIAIILYLITIIFFYRKEYFFLQILPVSIRKLLF